MGHHGWMRKKQETFADLLASAPHPSGQEINYLQPLASGEYADAAGVLWRIRRGELSWTRIARSVRDPQISVVHVYLNEVRTIAPEDREAFLQKIRPYVAGPVPDDNTDFEVAEFRDDYRRSMILVEETC
jgi:hypothetical protein